jgi:hypothetical protein
MQYMTTKFFRMQTIRCNPFTVKKNELLVVRVEGTVRERLQRLATADDRSLSYMARLAMERGLPSLETELLPQQEPPAAIRKTRKAA